MIRDSAIEVAESVRAGRRRAVEVLDEALAAVAEADPALNAWVVVDEGLARRAAEAVDATVARGDDPGPLAGVPFGVKDLEDCAGFTTGHGSLVYADHPPAARDSLHVARMRAAGAVPLGKTAAPEFGTLNFTKNRVTGVTRNPWDPSRTPGGSSGGSAAAVASGMVPMATASDGGGSTRIPAAFAGLVGFKPSHGRIANPSAQASQTSVVGVVTTTVADAARHLDVTAGPDEADRLSLPPAGVVYEQAIASLDVSGLRVAWSSDLGFAAVAPDVEEVARSAAGDLVEAAGMTWVEREVSLTDPVRAWMSSGAVDLWLDLEPGMWPERADDLTLYVRQVFEQTESYQVSRYARALQRRLELQRETAALFHDVDVWLTPTTAVTAFAAEGPPPDEIAGRPVGPAMATPFTMLANLCWGPACSLPAGLGADGLPVGLQVMARRHADEVVLRLARVLEEARPWPRWAPERP
ncbi:MAG TPA: amidase family protein [Acidimicrobiales bacterium]|nr:amidase family protein [Acidimicrobiales bacterium]